MDVAVGVGRPVVQHVRRRALARVEDARVQLRLGPAREDLGLALGQVRLHRERRVRQVQRRFVVHAEDRELSTRRRVGYPRLVPTVSELLRGGEGGARRRRSRRGARRGSSSSPRKLQATGDEAATAEARALLATAARDGSAMAAFDLAMLLFAGRGGPVDTAAGLVVARARGARARRRRRRCSAGCCSSTPRARPKASPGCGARRRRARRSAFWLLGAAHLRGLGVAVDAHQARLLFAAAAEAGVVEAQLELARLYRQRHRRRARRRRRRRAGSARRRRRAAPRAACVWPSARRRGGAAIALAIPWLERAARSGQRARRRRGSPISIQWVAKCPTTRPPPSAGWRAPRSSAGSWEPE